MKNADLAKDYIHRCEGRLLSVKLLFEKKYFADAVRESQELVELALKAVLRHALVDAPHIHDVGDLIEKHLSSMPPQIQKNIALIKKISKSLRKDRELAFYGSEDLTPSQFYKKEDAKEAVEWAEKILILAKSCWD